MDFFMRKQAILLAFFASLILEISSLNFHQTYVRPAFSFDTEGMKCSYGERGSLTATCINATASFFKSTPYRFDQLDETLKCVNCNLSSLYNGAFDIAGNQIKNLDLTDSKIKNIGQKSFTGLIYLENLILVNNSITSIYPGTFSGVQKIKTVDLEYNNINILSKDGFMELRNLQKLILRNNKIRTIDIDAFNGLNSLVMLDLSNNMISELSSCFQNLSSLQVLYLQYNHILTLTGEEFNLTSLEYVDLSNNKLKQPVFYVNPVNSLNTLDLSMNNIDRLSPNSFKGLHQLERLDLSFNHIYDIPQKTLQFLFELTHLNISNNKLSKFQTGLFSGLPQLRLLNCSHNYIEDVEVTGVLSLHSLHTLDLSYNNVSDLDYVGLISRLPRLTYLNMRENLLPCDLEKDMEVFFAEDNFKFELYGSEYHARKCVNVPVTKKHAKAVADSLIKRAESSGSRTAEIIIFIMITFIILGMCFLFYVQYRIWQGMNMNAYSNRAMSRVQLVSSDLETNRDMDDLRE